MDPFLMEIKGDFREFSSIGHLKYIK